MNKLKMAKKITDGLDYWEEVKNDFYYKEYYDKENNHRMEFTNDMVSFVYFDELESKDNFWFGARHHIPMELVYDIMIFFKKFGQ